MSYELRNYALTSAKRLSEYKDALMFLLRELLSNFPKEVASITTKSFLGATLSGTVLAAGLYYIKMLENDSIVQVFGRELAARESFGLILVILGLVSLLGLSAWLSYSARFINAGLIKLYQIHQTAKILRTPPSRIEKTNFPISADAASKNIFREVISKAHQSAVLVRFLGRVIPSITTLGYSIPIVLYLDPILTIYLFMTLCAFVPLFYRANIRAYESTIIGREVQKSSGQQLKATVEKTKEWPINGTETRKINSDKLIRGAWKHRLEVLPMYLRSLARTEFLINLLLGLSVGILLALRIPDALNATRDWSALLAYLVFLRLALSGFEGVFSFLGIFSKLYPSTRKYQSYVGPKNHAASSPSRPNILLSTKTLSNQPENNTIFEKAILSVQARSDLNRFTLPYIFDFQNSHQSGIKISRENCLLISNKNIYFRDPSSDGVVSNEHEKAILRRDICKLGLNSGNLACESNTLATEDWLMLLGKKDHTLMSLVAAARSQQNIVIVPQEFLLKIKKKEVCKIFEHLKENNKIIVIYYDRRKGYRDIFDNLYGAMQLVILSQTGEILAYGPPEEIKVREREIRDLIRREKSQRAMQNTNTEDDEDGEDIL